MCCIISTSASLLCHIVRKWNGGGHPALLWSTHSRELWASEVRRNGYAARVYGQDANVHDFCIYNIVAAFIGSKLPAPINITNRLFFFRPLTLRGAWTIFDIVQVSAFSARVTQKPWEEMRPLWWKMLKALNFYLISFENSMSNNSDLNCAR